MKLFRSSFMKNLVYLIAFLAVFSCGKVKPEGDIKVQEVNVGEFSEIEGKGKFRLFWVNSNANRVDVETYPNVFDNLSISVKDNKLFIEESKETQGVDFYNITVYSKQNPSKISLSDSIEFNVSGEIKTDDFKLNLKNNAKFIGAVRTNRAEVDMENTSLANFKGYTKKSVVKMKDTANLLAPYWFIDRLQINSENGTYAEVNVKDSIKGNVKNTAKFLYYNDPIRAFKIEEKAQVQNKTLN